jgi:GNAT superfamily N-acetyltransferase
MFNILFPLSSGHKIVGPEVFKTYDDGYIVRAMTSSDAKIVQNWYAGMGAISQYDLDVPLRVFPRGREFYIGEYEGTVVASWVQIPWGNGVYYGSYYYVHEDYRGKGFGTRLRDQVAYGHVLEANGKLCIDSVEGPVAEKNVSKFGYVEAFVTRRFCGVAKDFGVKYNGILAEVSSGLLIFFQLCYLLIY